MTHLETLVGSRAARNLLDRFGTVRAILHAEPASLTVVPGIGPKTAERLIASFALAREAMNTPSSESIRTPDQAIKAFGDELRVLPHMEVRAMYLSRQFHVLSIRTLTRGNDAFTIVDPRQVLRPAVELGAHAVILASNHPSGVVEPSSEDKDVANRVQKAAKIVGVGLLDYIVFGGEDTVSLADRGDILPQYPPRPSFAKVNK